MNARPIIQRDPPYRNRKLLDVAHEAPCFMEVPSVCQSGVHPSVPAHSNSQRHGRGVGHKSHDVFVAAACGPCHDWYDRGPAPREEKEARFARGLERYWLWLWRNDRIKVS